MDQKKDKKPSFSEMVADHKAEAKKIVWPQRAEVVKKTATVLVTSLFIGVVLFCMDSIFTGLQSLIVNVLS